MTQMKKRVKNLILITLKMRFLSSETIASPPLKWTTHVKRRIAITTPITLTVAKIGNLTTGGVAILERESDYREREREKKREIEILMLKGDWGIKEKEN